MSNELLYPFDAPPHCARRGESDFEIIVLPDCVDLGSVTTARVGRSYVDVKLQRSSSFARQLMWVEQLKRADTAAPRAWMAE